MTDNKIFKIIDRMSDYIDSHNAGPLSKDKIKISKERLLDYVDQLRQALPGTLEEAEKITNAKNEMLKAAKSKAAKIEAAAEEKLKEIVKDDEIVIAAEKEADYIVADAEKQADYVIKEAEDMAGQIKNGALSYAGEKLATVEKMVSHNLNITIDNSNSVIDTLKNNLEIIQSNRGELTAQLLDAREVVRYDEESEDENISENSEDEFAVNVNSDDFEEEEDSVSSKDNRVSIKSEDDFEDEDDEDEDEELYDFAKKFSFKKNGK